MSKKLIPFEISFEPGYEQFSQKISELNKNNKIVKSQINIQKLQHELDLIKQEIQDQGLQFLDNPIFSRYATIQQLAIKKKQAPQCCPHCGQQIKKQVQCEICAQLYCKNCCWRKRVIPQSQHKDFRLCCEDCHSKYIKLFSNQKFYKEKQLFLKVIQQLAKKYQKSQNKLNAKKVGYKSYQDQKMNFKMKQGTLKKQIMDEQKKYNKLKEQFQQLIKLKAIKIKERQKRKQQEEQLKKMQDQKRRQQEQKRLQQQQKRRIQQKTKNQHILNSSQKKKADQQQHLYRQKIKKQLQIKAQKQRQKQKQAKQEELNKQRQQMQKERAAMQQQKKRMQKQKQQLKLRSEQLIKIKAQYESPKKQIIDKGQTINKTQVADQKKQIKMQADMIQNTKGPQAIQIENQKEPDLKEDNNLIKAQKLSQISDKVNKNSSSTEQNIFSNLIKKQSQQQILSPIRVAQQTLTMTNIKSMNINDLLGMKIPMNPNKVDRNSKIQQTPINALKSTRQSRQSYSQSKDEQINQSRVSRHSNKEQESQHSVKSFNQEESLQQKRMTKDDLLRRSSLISSKQNTIIGQPQQIDQQGVDGRNNCTCQIM